MCHCFTIIIDSNNLKILTDTVTFKVISEESKLNFPQKIMTSITVK